jgi:excisionase family DNA binding protein
VTKSYEPTVLNSYSDVDEVAAFLRVPRSWVYDRTRRGAIPMRRVGRYVRFDLAEIQAWAKVGCPAQWDEE